MSPKFSLVGVQLTGRSHDWECPQCGKMKDQIPDTPAPLPEDRASHSDQLAVSEGQTAVTTASKVEEDSETREECAVSELRPQERRDPNPVSVDARPAPPHETQPAPTPTVPAPRVHIHHTPPDQRQAPMWIDAMIVVGLAILVTMLYRKIGNSSNLIETVSL
jgi:hypothetical protein